MELGIDAPSETNRAIYGSVAEVYGAQSIAEIQQTLCQLRTRDAAVTVRLDELVASQKDLGRQWRRLDVVGAGLGSEASKVRSISTDAVTSAASSAETISSAVKRLDLEQSRVKATVEVVDQVAELKACVLGVTGSMGAPQDWETAASYLSRASKIPKEVTNGPFAARVVPTAEVPDTPNVTLDNASESLCGLFLREFDKAVQENDGNKITRFFKLFPLIGKSAVGLDVYGRYVCQGVADRARLNLNAGTGGAASKDGFFFASAFTKLFEHVAQIIDGHGSLIERHYGAGKTIPVIERLQVEVDMQGGIILDTWTDERQIDRKLTDIKSYAYTFLVQSFLSVPRGNAGTPRSNSPAQAGSRQSEDEGVNMKEVDALLNEMAVMLGKWALYVRFLVDKCKISDDDESAIPRFLANASLARKVTDRLVAPFNAMTIFFFRRSVEKAFQLDESPSDLSLNPHKPLHSSPPYISSAVDDIMYIFNKILQQSLATAQKDVVCSIVPTLSRVMGADFTGMIQRKMRDESYPRAAVQGALPPESTIIAFLVLINNVDVAMDYVKQIIYSHVGSSEQPLGKSLAALFPLTNDSEAVHSTLTSLAASFENKTSELLNDSIQVIFNNVMKPRLRPILLDAFRDVEYQLTKEEIQELTQEEGRDEEDGDLVRRRFQHGWDALTKPIGRIMSNNTFDKLLVTIVSYLSKLLEKKIWSYHGRVNALGAVRLERDVHHVAGVVVHGKKYAYRDAFSKCTHICIVMNMEEDEWEEVRSNPGSQADIADRLTAEERTRARAIVKELD